MAYPDMNSSVSNDSSSSSVKEYSDVPVTGVEGWRGAQTLP